MSSMDSRWVGTEVNHPREPGESFSPSGPTRMDNSDHHHTGSTSSANKPADQPSPARRERPLQKQPANATPDSGHQFLPSGPHAAPAHDSGTKGAVRGLHSRHAMGTSHDMSDPAMAASMEADFRTRFWVALALSALVVLISPMGGGGEVG